MENVANRFSKHGSLCLLAGCNLLDLLSNPEDGSRTFLQNIGELIPNYKSSHPRG
jgi:hypothetical protein